MKCMLPRFSPGYLKNGPTCFPLSTHLYPPPQKKPEVGMQTGNCEKLQPKPWIAWEWRSRRGELYKEINFALFLKETFSSLSPDISVWIKNYTRNAVQMLAFENQILLACGLLGNACHPISMGFKMKSVPGDKTKPASLLSGSVAEVGDSPCAGFG